MEPKMQEATCQLNSIGYVRHSEDSFRLEILEPYRAGLKQLDQFSHVIVVWWADQHDKAESRGIMETEPPYAAGQQVGVFACRAEYRPNPVALTVCKMTEVDEEDGTVRLEYIDAFDGTPVVDLKAYFPVADRVKEVRVPSWVSGWPDWVEEAYKLTS